MIETLRLDRVPPVPWRNHGGSTQVLLALPQADDWRWRVSVARIERDGDFSAYPGVDRWIAVVDGHGLVLRAGERRLLLERGGPPAHFDGGVAPHAELSEGPTRDLNLMVRRDAARGEMLRAEMEAEWVSAAPWRAVFVAGPVRLQIDDADAARLAPMSLAWSTHATRQRWRLLPDAEPVAAWWMAVRPVGP